MRLLWRTSQSLGDILFKTAGQKTSWLDVLVWVEALLSLTLLLKGRLSRRSLPRQISWLHSSLKRKSFHSPTSLKSRPLSPHINLSMIGKPGSTETNSRKQAQAPTQTSNFTTTTSLRLFKRREQWWTWIWTPSPKTLLHRTLTPNTIFK